MTAEVALDRQTLDRLLDAAARPRSSIPNLLAMSVSAAALVMSGAALGFVFAQANAQGVPMQAVAPVQAAAPAPVALASPGSPPASVLAQPVPTASEVGKDTRIAQSEDGSIYAFDPGTGLSFRFDSQAGPVPISMDLLPADARARLVSGGQSTPPMVDAAALEQQTALARAGISAQAGDQSRPPLNDMLGDTKVVSDIVASLDQAQGIVRPGPDGDTTPVVYGFFDPKCPYCHAAFEALDGKHPVKWMPLSVLGPNGDRLHAYIMGDVQLGEALPAVSPDDSSEPASQPTAHLTDDPGRGQRLAEVMLEEVSPPDAELSDGHRFVLTENAEMFRLLSSGAEDMRAVPTFFVRAPDGTAVWHRGFDDSVPGTIAAIISGDAQ